MAESEPERDENGYLPDETIFKVHAKRPILRWSGFVFGIGFLLYFLAERLGVIQPPTWLNVAVLIGFFAAIIASIVIQNADDIARLESSDHAPGAYERAFEAWRARSPRLWAVLDAFDRVSESIQRWGWKIGVAMIAIAIVMTIWQFLTR